MQIRLDTATARGRAHGLFALETELSHTCGDDCHFVDLVGVASAGQVVDRCIQTLENRTVSLKAAESLCDLIADGAGFANLSGGQKQRILVARALAARPEILVLDDSSSALDYRTDAAMRRAIRERHPDATLILIAQRVSSVMQLDRILVMDNGRCIGLGSHEELMARCPAYKEICEIQMGEL